MQTFKKKSHLIILAFNNFATKVIKEIETNKGSIDIFAILKSHIIFHHLQQWRRKNNIIIGGKKICDTKKGV
jgi:hypothetical protein